MIQNRIVYNRIKMLCAALLTVSALTGTSVAAAVALPLTVYADESVKDEDATGTVTGKSLNVRSGSGKDYDSIGKLSQGDTVKITGVCDNGWYRIDLDGKEGYVSDQYVEKAAASSDQSSDQTEAAEEEGEPETGYDLFHPSPNMKHVLFIAPALLLVIGAIVFTLKKMRDDDDDDEDYDDFSDDDEEYDDEEDDDDDEEDEDDVEGAPSRKREALEEQPKPSKSYIIREEDYQVHIDPSFFEDVDPIEQPAMVTGYLDRLQAEKDALSKEIAEPSEKLDKEEKINQAMAKLTELQKEIERLKNE